MYAIDFSLAAGLWIPVTIRRKREGYLGKYQTAAEAEEAAKHFNGSCPPGGCRRCYSENRNGYIKREQNGG